MPTERPGYRPLTGLALKSVSDTLRPHFGGETGLDLYAGSGAFGLAALKEGAQHVTFVEKHRPTAHQIEREVKKFYPPSSFTVLTKDVMSFLQGNPPSTKFGFIFMDPPFADWSPELAASLIRLAIPSLTDSGILLVKCPSRMLPSSQFSAALESRLKPWKVSKFGESTLLYFRNGDEKG